MQGRLSPRVDGRIQAFPWNHWRTEFEQAARLDLRLMEWTLDAERLRENPLMTQTGREAISDLATASGVRVASLTADCFMQEPFFKATKQARASLVDDLDAVIAAAAALSIAVIVVPLVDAGSVQTSEQERVLREVLLERVDQLRGTGVTIAFESDFDPTRLARFIAGFPSLVFGINYDTGNSASYGFDAAEEMRQYGGRVLNVHVKDRVLGGSTVPLGSGALRPEAVFTAVCEAGYRGNFILQTARAPEGADAAVLAEYRDIVRGWLEKWCDAA